MSVRDWFRPPRQMLLVLFVVALALTTTVGWLGWELVSADRADLRRRHEEDLKRAANVATAALDRQLSALERRLDADEAVDRDRPLPAGVTRVVVRGATVRVEPAGSLPYLPHGVSSDVPYAQAFVSATRLENVDRDLRGALRNYVVLAQQGGPAIEPVALNRVARVQRKLRDWPAALATYGRLADLGNTAIEGLPALLVARVGRIAVREATGDISQIEIEAAALKKDLEEGRLHLTKAQFGSYAAEVARWTGAPPAVDADAVARAEALRRVSERVDRDGTGSGRVLVSVGGGAALASWRASGTAALSTIVMGPGALSQFVESAMPQDIVWAVSDPSGGFTIGHSHQSEDAFTLPAAVSGLPWTLHVAAAFPGAVGESPRLARLVAVLVGVVVLAGVGWYFLWRGISREVRVARLQADFVDAVSHEFRSPLTSLRYIAELLATDRVASEERRQRSYALLVNETERLGHLVEGLLDFRRLQDGQLTFQFEPSKPADLVREVVGQFERRLDSGAHRIDLRADEALPAVLVDREAFGRALWNLLDNAMKYSPAAAAIDVRVHADPETRRVAVTVRDEGPGIPADEQTLIFDRFVRGADAKARRIKGTGIGLAMAREIARAHGGDLTVASSPGAGSAFTIALPPAGT